MADFLSDFGKAFLNKAIFFIKITTQLNINMNARMHIQVNN
jgi:hypothetical protein